MTPTRSRWTGLLAVILVGALLVRFAVFLYASPKPDVLFAPDSFGYERLAVNLLRHGVFSMDAQEPFRPETARTPGYPTMIAAVYAVAGRSPEAVAFLQVLLGAATVGLAFLLARPLGMPARAGLVAAAVLALEPVSVMVSSVLLTEVLFTAVLTAALGLLAVWWRNGQLRWLAAAAALLGTASLVRPVAQFLPVALLAVVAVVAVRRGPKHTAAAMLVFLGLSMGITYSWAYRNHQVTGEWTLSTIADVNLVYYRAREVLASAEGLSQEEAWLKLEQLAREAAPTGPRGAAEREIALRVFAEHPMGTAAMFARGAARIFADPGFTTACTLLAPGTASMECLPGTATMNEADVVGKAGAVLAGMSMVQRAVLAWSALMSVALYLAALAGFALLVRERRWFVLALLLIPMAYLVAVSAGAEAYSRFRIPFLPQIALLAGVACEGFIRGRTRPRSSRPAAVQEG